MPGASKLPLPNEERVKVNVAPNETPDTATINRSPNRLLSNDQQLRDWICNLDETTLTNGITGDLNAASGGTLGLDSAYVNSIVNIDQILSATTLEALSDVNLTTPTDYDFLQYSSVSSSWFNGPIPFEAVNATISAAFIENLDHVVDLTHGTSALQQTIPTTVSATEYTYEFPISGFGSGSSVLEVDKVFGFFIFAQNFGRLNEDREGLGGADWRTMAQFPDGNYYVVNGYHAENIDDDGGCSQTAFVPFNPNISDTIRIKVCVENANATHVDSKGIPLNSFEIISMSQKTDAIGITPDTDSIHIKGITENNDAGVLLSGEIITSSSVLSGYNTWTSMTPGVTNNDWTNILPIPITGNIAKTEIDFINYLTLEENTTVDLGAEEGSIGFARGNIWIDWLTKEMHGTFMLYGGSPVNLQGTGILSGSIGGYNPFVINTFGGGKNVRCGITTQFRRINSLPCVVDIDNGRCANNVMYTIRNYKVVGVDSLPSIETFTTTSSSNVVAHGMSQTPHMAEVYINGRPVNSYFKETPNGTDGGLKYRFAYVRVDGTNITVVPNTVSLPGGDRRYSAMVFPE